MRGGLSNIARRFELAAERLRKERQDEPQGERQGEVREVLSLSNTGFDEIPEERVEGEYVRMSPRLAVNHNRVMGNIFFLFRQFLRGKAFEAFSSGVNLYLDEGNVLVPDVMIVCNPDHIQFDGVYGAPGLVVEVLSPTTAARDRGVKFRRYEKAGVKEYWIVSPEAMSIEVYLLKEGRMELDEVYVVPPAWAWEKMSEKERAETKLRLKVSLSEGFLIDVREVFENVRP